MKFFSQLSAATSSYEEVETKVSDRDGSYAGLTREALLTSWEDFQLIFEELPYIRTWIELGSGHGYGPLIFAHLNPQKNAIGVEFDHARFLESERLKNCLNIPNASFVNADLMTAEIPDGDVYFLYFPTGIVLDRILHVLGKREQNFRLVVIESHGDLLPRLKLETWLEVEKEIPLTSVRHYPSAVVFKKISERSASVFDHSFQENYFLIRDDEGGEWLGDTYGMQWQTDNSLMLLFPPRTVRPEQIVKILTQAELSDVLLKLVALRRAELSPFQGHIRKIFPAPLCLELSSGQLISSDDILKIMAGNTPKPEGTI